jgi:HK97 family phage portal protein
MEALFSEANEAKYFPSRGVWSTATGLSVSPETALQATAVLACVRVLSETIASLPLVLYQRLEKGKKRAVDHYLYPILHDQANSEMTSFEFREVSMLHLTTWGNSYANIELDGAGQVTALWPLRPDRMTVSRVRTDAGSELVYKYQLPQSVGGQPKILRQYEVLHIRGLSPDGIIGYSPIGLARQAVGLSLAMEEFGGRYFGNGAIPGIALLHPNTLSDQAYKHLKESWEEEHQGLTQAHRFAILEEGMALEKIGIPPEDSQFIQSRQMQVEEIARIYRMPPHMIQDLLHSTFSNIEHQAIEFVVHTLRPWCVRWEQRLRMGLLGPEEAKIFFAEFLVDGLLRGDIATRFAAYAMARQNGWMNANEIRELENQNPIEDGGIYLVPLNMISMGSPSAATTEQARGGAGVSLVPLSDYARLMSLRPSPQSAAVPPEGHPAQVTGAGPDRCAADGSEDRASEAAEKLKAAKARLVVAKSYRRVFKDVGERAVKRELREIKQAAGKFLDKRAQTANFEEWLRDYYRDFPEVLNELWSPTFFAIGEAIQGLAANEVGAPVGMTPGLDECLQYHIDRSVARHATLSTNLVLAALAAGDGSADSITEAIADWPERRPAAFAAWETIRTSNLMAKATYFYAGATGLEWVRLDENPFCVSLEGRIIEMGDNCRGTHFVMEGEEVPGRSERSDGMTTSWNVSTPPLFEGCECQIAPVMPDPPRGRQAAIRSRECKS